MTKMGEMDRLPTLKLDVLGAPNMPAVDFIPLNRWHLLGAPNKYKTLQTDLMREGLK